jgi:hypothetical protein
MSQPDAPGAVSEEYTEAQASQLLNISISRLHLLLDTHVFNDGTARPEQLSFRPSDLALLSFWNRTTPNPKVVRMPRRA